MKVEMGDTAWFLVIGLLLTAMAFAGSVLKRAPLSAAIFYLAAGYAVGPAGAGMLDLRLPAGAAAVERLAEVAVLVLLFTAGLKLRVPPGDRRWLLPLRLAFLAMAVTVGLVALAGVFLLGLHDLGAGGWRWLAMDVAWGVAAGPAVGWALGTGAGKLVLYLRRRHQEAVGLDDFLTLGLIALGFGLADLIHAYGFLAVFAAGVALRRVEMRESWDASREELRERRKAVDEEELATDPRTAPSPT